MKYVFIDIETTNEHLDFEIDKSELIEIGAFDLESQKEFQSFVKVSYPLSEFTKRLTGIKDSDIQNGKDVKVAIQNFIDFLGDPNDIILVGHNIEGFDIPVLSKYSDLFQKYKYLDTLQLFWLFYPSLEQYTVQFLYKHFMKKDDYKEQHRALQDAKEEAELFEKVFSYKQVNNYRKNKGKDLDFLSLLRENNIEIKQKTESFLSPLKNKKGQSLFSDFMKNNYIFNFIKEEFINSDVDAKNYTIAGTLSKKKVFEKFFRSFDYIKLKKTDYNYDDNINTDENEIMDIYKKCLGNKGQRQQQIQIVKNINDIMNGKFIEKTVGIEAGTGVGKTYGYLIPSMNFLNNNPKYKIFVSTYTKVLQGQIMKEDIHNLGKYFENVKYCNLKANTEGFDLNALPLVSKNFSLYHLILWIWILRENYYFTDVHFGIVNNLNHFQNTNYIYSPYNAKQKKDYNKEFGFKGFLQHQIHFNNLFVVNHNFVLSQFGGYTKDTQISGYYEEMDRLQNFKYYIVFDEGHNLEPVMREYFTLSYDIQTFNKIIDFLIPGGKTGNIFDMLDNEITNILYGIKEESISDEITKEYKNIESDFEKIKSDFTGSISDKNLDDYLQATIGTFQNTDLFRISQIAIRKLREKYSIDSVFCEQQELYERYFLDGNNQFTKIINKLYETIGQIYKHYKSYLENLYSSMDKNSIKHEKIDDNRLLNQIQIIGKYLKKGKSFLSSFDRGDNFVEGVVEFNEGLETVRNFGFKIIPRNLHNYKKFINQSEGVCLLSATLYDGQGENSYVLQEISGNEGYKKFESIKSPFDYEKNRKIIVPEMNIDNDNSEILFNQKAKLLLEYINKYDGRTLVLTTNNKDKDKIANFLYDNLNKKGIMIKKHEGGTMNSKSNQQNIQALIDNPRTVLIGSKSYMEGVDIPGPHLSLVVLWKLPFLPPRPFIEFQNNKPEYRKNNLKYVYQFLCGMVFKQAIGRLIRTETDTGEILILDPRIKDQSGLFFNDYL